jgi:hypothetical protein
LLARAEYAAPERATVSRAVGRALVLVIVVTPLYRWRFVLRGHHVREEQNPRVISVLSLRYRCRAPLCAVIAERDRKARATR